MPLASDIIPYLSSVPPFDQLPADTIERLAHDIEVSYHIAGDDLGHFGGAQRVTELYLVRAGAVALHREQGDLLEQRSEGEIFGHRIHFAGEAMPYNAIALEDTLLWRIHTQRMQRLCDDYPQLEQWLWAEPGKRLHTTLSDSGTIHSIQDLHLRPTVTATPDMSIRACAQLMTQRQVSALPFIENGELLGILTNRDLRTRVIAAGVDSEQPARTVISPRPITVALEETVENALVTMLRHGIHHLAVTDADGTLQAIVSSGDLLRVQSPHPLRLVRDISRAESVSEVARLAHLGPDILGRLAAELKDVSQVGRIAGLITDACTRRLLELGEAALGPPPFPYTWLAFGSQARLEQALISDQDNGMLLAQTPQGTDADYFEQLSRQVCDGLAECGYTHCKGGVMAMGKWRLSLERWRETFHRWINEPEPKAVMHCSIFFDMRPVYGDLELAHELRRHVLREASGNRIFLHFLVTESLTHKPPLGFFRQFVQEHGGGHSHGLNLKQRGVIPIVDMARVLALEGALTEVHTEERLLAAAAAELTTPGDAANLIQAQRFIVRVRLEHQARQAANGEPLDHLVDPAGLSSLHRRYLRSAFNVVRSAQQNLAQRFLV